MSAKNVQNRICAFLFTLLLLLSPTVLAEVPDSHFTPTETTDITTQLPPQSEPTDTPAKATENQEIRETTSPPEIATPPANTNQSEDAMNPSSVADETSTPSPTENEPEEDSLSITEQTPSPSTQPEGLGVSIELRWDIPATDDLLRIGEPITLTAEIATEAEGIQLQWQIATKPAKDLADNEPEWVHIPGATTLKYPFTVLEEMQFWRWRLCASIPHGETVYSSEISLPRLSMETDDLAQAEEDETLTNVNATPPLPVENITLTSDVPLDELSFGDEVTLVADIQNASEDMLLQWQYRYIPEDMEPAEEAWQDVEEATESAYTYVIDEENEQWIWRLLITVPEEQAEELPQEEASEDGEGQTVEADSGSAEEVIMEALPTPTADISEEPVPEQMPEGDEVPAEEE